MLAVLDLLRGLGRDLILFGASRPQVFIDPQV